MIESVYPAALSVHEHVHAGEDEMFYLLGGEMEVFCGEDRWTVGAGSFVFVPRDRPHGFTVSSAGPARALVITGPSRLAAQVITGLHSAPGGVPTGSGGLADRGPAWWLYALIAAAALVLAGGATRLVKARR